MVNNNSGISTKMHPSKIIGIQFSILSPEEIRKSSVAEITSRDTYINNKPVINGLFDPRMGVLEPGLICPTDGLNYMETPGYFGHIEDIDTAILISVSSRSRVIQFENYPGYLSHIEDIYNVIVIGVTW